VRYWGIGKENWGCGGDMTAKKYAGLFRRFALFAPAFGGLKPFLIACGPNRNDTSWSNDFMDSVPPRRFPDGFAMHYYAEGKNSPAAYTAADMAAQLATFSEIEQAVIQQRALLDGYDSGRNVGCSRPVGSERGKGPRPALAGMYHAERPCSCARPQSV
jgi:alpha-L-arabinofuranosidase